MNAQPIVRVAGEGDKRSFLGGGLHTWKLMAEDTDGAFFLFEDLLSNGKTTPLHLHPEADETVYVLEGEIVVSIDGEPRLVPAFTPRVPHVHRQCRRAQLLSMQTPVTRPSAAPAVRAPIKPLGRHRTHQSLAQENPRSIWPPPFEAIGVA
jgi:hypothetical protein